MMLPLPQKRVYQDELKGQLNKFFETETVGLIDYTENDKLMKRIKFNSIQYCVKLPFREQFVKLKNKIVPIIHSYKKSFFSSDYELLNKLNPYLLATYDEIIKTCKIQNIIEKIETAGKRSLVYYLSHRAVIKNERETK